MKCSAHSPCPIPRAHQKRFSLPHLSCRTTGYPDELNKNVSYLFRLWSSGAHAQLQPGCWLQRNHSSCLNCKVFAQEAGGLQWIQRREQALGELHTHFWRRFLRPHALLTRIPWMVCSGAVNTNLTQEIITIGMAVYVKMCISTYVVGRENKWKRSIILNCNAEISCLKLGKKGVGSSVFLAQWASTLHHNFVLTVIIQRSLL